MDLSGATKFLNGRTINNAGTATWTAGPFTTSSGAVFNNQLGATFETDFDGSFTNGFGAQSQFNNTGTFTKSGGTGTTTVGVEFNNSGTVEIDSGTLKLSVGGISTGSFTGEVGTILYFSGGIHDLDAGSSVTSAGTVQIGGGTWNLNDGSYNVTGTTAITGGTVNFNTPANTNLLNLSGGVLSGSADITASGLITWSALSGAGGEMSGAGTTHANGGMDLSGSTKFLTNGRTINNAGTATWTAGPFTTSSGAVFNNQLGATFETDFDGSFTNGAGAQSQFNNTGTFTKSGGTGTTTVGVEFNNTGSVNVNSGTLNLSGDFSNFSSATNTLTGGAYHVTTTLKFQNADINTNQAAITLDGPSAQIVDSSNVDALADLSLNDVGAEFVVAGGKHFTTSATYTNSGVTTVSDGTFTADAFVNAASGTLSGSGTVEIAGAGQVLTNNGVVAPGDSPGTLSITGDFTQGPLGTLQIEIGGLVAGSEFDQLLVSETATLAGALDVSIIGGFAPEFGDAFTVLDAGSLADEFTGLAEGATLSADGVEFGVTYLSDGGSAVELTVTGFTLPADFNFDGHVNALDLGIWQAGYGSGSLHSQGDANGDGEVNGRDFLDWQRQFGSSLSPLAETTAVPEPSSLLLVAFTSSLLCLRMRRESIR
jgi:hypothetical protein